MITPSSLQRLADGTVRITMNHTNNQRTHYQQNNAVVEFTNRTKIRATLGGDQYEVLGISLSVDVKGHPDHQATFVIAATSGMRMREENFTANDFLKYGNGTSWKFYEPADM